MTDGELDCHDLPFLKDARLVKLLGLLDGGGEEARVIGGAVRNALLNQDVADIDIATTATPAEVVARARAARLRIVPTGIDHGTVTVIVGGAAFEVTTLRADVETDGRHATVRFSRDFDEDAQRRDFTINALSVSVDGRIHDTTGGMADLAARRVRFIGAADRRIAEDFLRILRFFRFHAAYGLGPLDGEGFAAAIRGRLGLARLSRERIAAEMFKLLAAPGAAPVIASMSEAGLLAPCLNGIAYPARLARLAAVEQSRGETPDAMLRLAALAVATTEDARRLREHLRLSNEAARRLETAAAGLVPLHAGRRPPPLTAIGATAFRQGARGTRDALMLAHAESGAAIDDPCWTEAHTFARANVPPQMPVSGADIVARGVATGPKVGAILKRFQADWIRAGFPREPETLARLLDEAVTSFEGRLGLNDG